MSVRIIRGNSRHYELYSRLIIILPIQQCHNPFCKQCANMNQLKHRHQRCKASSLCKTSFITNICRLKVAGQKIYIYYNFLTMSFSPALSHNIFLTTSSLPLHFRPHNVVLTTSRYTRNLSLCLMFRPP